jgi:hypothetical protein
MIRDDTVTCQPFDPLIRETLIDWIVNNTHEKNETQHMLFFAKKVCSRV